MVLKAAVSVNIYFTEIMMEKAIITPKLGVLEVYIDFFFINLTKKFYDSNCFIKWVCIIN